LADLQRLLGVGGFPVLSHYSTATNAVAFTATALLGADDGLTTYLDGDVAEFVMFSAKLSTADRAAMLAYLQDKYGL
jgi:hypothetical protein